MEGPPEGESMWQAGIVIVDTRNLLGLKAWGEAWRWGCALGPRHVFRMIWLDVRNRDLVPFPLGGWHGSWQCAEQTWVLSAVQLWV